ncbi:hypothetical protein RRG08_025239 [Elysia crispata]|uniref:Uncharacterized protein n=1 Tax=Elysia crispata TaxID=231223 RepID=A0AAE1AAP1_9GAST|nr:hypothetical protein RRG08_025239 [Elysia crispata]
MEKAQLPGDCILYNHSLSSTACLTIRSSYENTPRSSCKDRPTAQSVEHSISPNCSLLSMGSDPIDLTNVAYHPSESHEHSLGNCSLRSRDIVDVSFENDGRSVALS